MKWLRRWLTNALRWGLKRAAPSVSIGSVQVGWRSITVSDVVVDIPVDRGVLRCSIARVTISADWHVFSLPSSTIDIHGVCITLQPGEGRQITFTSPSKLPTPTQYHSVLTSIAVSLAKQTTLRVHECRLEVSGELDVLCLCAHGITLQSTDASFQPLSVLQVDCEADSLFYRLSIAAFEVASPSSGSAPLCHLSDIGVNMSLCMRSSQPTARVDVTAGVLGGVVNVDTLVALRNTVVASKAITSTGDEAVSVSTLPPIALSANVSLRACRVDLPDVALALEVGGMNTCVSSIPNHRATASSYFCTVTLLSTTTNVTVVRIDGGDARCDVTFADRSLQVRCTMESVTLHAEEAVLAEMTRRLKALSMPVELPSSRSEDGTYNTENTADKWLLIVSYKCNAFHVTLLDVRVDVGQLDYAYDGATGGHSVHAGGVCVCMANDIHFLQAASVCVTAPQDAPRALRVSASSVTLAIADLEPYERLKACVSHLRAIMGELTLAVSALLRTNSTSHANLRDATADGTTLHVVVSNVECDAGVSLREVALHVLLCGDGWQVDMAADVRRHASLVALEDVEGGKMALMLWADSQLRCSPFAGSVVDNGLAFTVHVEDAMLRIDDRLCSFVESLYDLAILLIYDEEDTHVYLRDDRCTMASLRGCVHIGTSDVTLVEYSNATDAPSIAIPALRAVAATNEDVVVEVDRYADKHMNVHVRLGPGASICRTQCTVDNNCGDVGNILPPRHGRVVEVSLHLTPCHAADLALFPYTRLYLDVRLDHCAFVADLATLGAVWSHFITEGTALWRLRSIASRVHFSNRASRGRTLPPLSPTSSDVQARGLATFMRTTGSAAKPSMTDYTEAILSLDLTIALHARASEVMYPWGEAAAAAPLYAHSIVSCCELLLGSRDECLRMELRGRLSVPRVVTSSDAAMYSSSPLCHPLFVPSQLDQGAAQVPWQRTPLALSLVYTNDARPPFNGGLADERYRISITGGPPDAATPEATKSRRQPVSPLQFVITDDELAAWVAALSFAHSTTSPAAATAAEMRQGVQHSPPTTPVRRYFVELRLAAMVVHLRGPRLVVALPDGLELTSSPLGMRVSLASASLFYAEAAVAAMPRYLSWTHLQALRSLGDTWRGCYADDDEEMRGALLSICQERTSRSTSARRDDSNSSDDGEEGRGSGADNAVCITSTATQGLTVDVGTVRLCLCVRLVALWFASDAAGRLKALHTLVRQHRQHLDSLHCSHSFAEADNLRHASLSEVDHTAAPPARQATRIQVAAVHVLYVWRSVLQHGWVCLASELHNVYFATQAATPPGACPDTTTTTTAALDFTVAHGQIRIMHMASHRPTRVDSPRLRCDADCISSSMQVWQSLYTMCSTLAVRTVSMSVPDWVRPDETRASLQDKDVPCILVMPVTLLVDQAAYVLLCEMAQQTYAVTVSAPTRAQPVSYDTPRALVLPTTSTSTMTEKVNTARGATSGISERHVITPSVQEGVVCGTTPQSERARGDDRHARVSCTTKTTRLTRWMLRLQSLQLCLRGAPEMTVASPEEADTTTSSSEAPDEEGLSVTAAVAVVATRSANTRQATPTYVFTPTCVTRLCVRLDDLVMAVCNDAVRVAVEAVALNAGEADDAQLVRLQRAFFRVAYPLPATAQAVARSAAKDGDTGTPVTRADAREPQRENDDDDDVTCQCASVCLDLRMPALLSMLRYLVQIPNRTLKASQRAGALCVHRITERVWTLENDLCLTRRGLVLLFSPADTNHIHVDMNGHGITIDETATVGGSREERVVIVVEAHLTVTFTNGVWRLPLAAMTASLMDKVQRDGVAVALLPYVAAGEASFVQCEQTRLTFVEPTPTLQCAALAPRIHDDNNSNDTVVAPQAPFTVRAYQPGVEVTAPRRGWHVGLPLVQLTWHIGHDTGLLRLATAAEVTLRCVDGAVMQSNAALTDLHLLLRRHDGSAATVLTRTSVDLSSQRGRHHALSVSAVNIEVTYADLRPVRALVAELCELRATTTHLTRSAAEVTLRGVIAELERTRHAGLQAGGAEDDDEARSNARHGASSETTTDADVARLAGGNSDHDDDSATTTTCSLAVYVPEAVLTLSEQRYPLCRVAVEGIIARQTTTPPGLRTLQLRCESCRAEVYGQGSWDTVLRRGEALSWCVTDTLSRSSGNRHLQVGCAGLQLHLSHLILAKTLLVARQLTRWSVLVQRTLALSDQSTHHHHYHHNEGDATATTTHRFFNAFDVPFYLCVGRVEDTASDAELLCLPPNASVDISVPYAVLDERLVTFFTAACVHATQGNGGVVELNAKGRAMNVAAAQTRVSALRYGTAIGLVVDEDLVVLSCVDESRTGRVAGQEALPHHRTVASDWWGVRGDAVDEILCDRESGAERTETGLPFDTTTTTNTNNSNSAAGADFIVVRVHPKLAVCNETGYTLMLHQRLVTHDNDDETLSAPTRRCLITGADCPLFHACVALVVECALNTKLYRGTLDVRTAANGHLLRLTPCDEDLDRKVEADRLADFTNSELHVGTSDRRSVVFVVAVRPLAESLSMVLTLYPRLSLLNHTGVPLNIALFQHDYDAGPAMDLDVALVQAWQQDVTTRHTQLSRPEVNAVSASGEVSQPPRQVPLVDDASLVALAAHHRLQHRQSLAINRCSLESDLLVGLSLSQSSGESIRTVGLVELVHQLREAIAHGQQHARQLTLRDTAGKAFHVQVTLLARTIVLSVAVWVHNLTEYPLLMTDAVLTRSLFAGLSPTSGIAPSQGTPFLVGTTLQNFRQVFFTIGLDGGWSNAVLMDVGASGSFESWQGKLRLVRSCNYVVQLPDPQEARPVVVLITPRWVLYNHTSKRLQLYFDFPGLTKAVQRAATAADTEATTAMSTVTSIQLNPGEYHVSCVGTIEGNRLALRERLEGTVPSVTSITDTAVQHKDAASFYESRRTGFLLIDGPTHATFNLWAAPRAAGRQMAVMYGEPTLAERRTVMRDAGPGCAGVPLSQMTPVDEYDRDAVVTGRVAVTVQALNHSLAVTLESIHTTRVQVQNRLRREDVMVHQAGVGHRNLVPAQQNRFFLWEDSRAEHVLRVHVLGHKGVWYEVDFTQGGCRVAWHDTRVDSARVAQTSSQRPFYVHGRTSADRSRVLLLVLETALPRYAEPRRWHTTLMLRISVSFFQLLWSYEPSRTEASTHVTPWQSLLSLALEGMSAEWLVTEENNLGVFLAIHQAQLIDEVRRRVFAYRARLLLQPGATRTEVMDSRAVHSTQDMSTMSPLKQSLPIAQWRTQSETTSQSRSGAGSAPAIARTESTSRNTVYSSQRSAPMLGSGVSVTQGTVSGRRQRREARLAEHHNDVQLAFNAIRYADGMLRLSELEASLTPFVLVLTDAWLAQVMREWQRVTGVLSAAQQQARRTSAVMPASVISLRPGHNRQSSCAASVLVSRSAFVGQMIELLEGRSGSQVALAEDTTGLGGPLPSSSSATAPLPDAALTSPTAASVMLDWQRRNGGGRSGKGDRHDALVIQSGQARASVHFSPHRYSSYATSAVGGSAAHDVRRGHGGLHLTAQRAVRHRTSNSDDESGAALARLSFILVETLSVAPVTLYVTLTRHHPDPLRPFLGAYTLMLPQQLKQTAFYLSAFTLRRRVETGASLRAHVAAWARKGLREQWTKVTKVGAVLEVLLWWQRHVALRNAPAALTLTRVSFERDAAQGGSIAFFSSSSSAASSSAVEESDRNAEDVAEERHRGDDEDVVALDHETSMT